MENFNQDFNQVDLNQFAYYQKDVSQKKTRHQRKQQKIEKLKHDMNDPEMKKQRHRIRRTQQKNKLQRELQGMSEQQARVYLDGKKQKKLLAKQKILDALKNNTQQIFIDMVYEKVMSEKENKSLAIQVQLIMKCIRHLESPPGIHLCSVGGVVEKQLQKMSYHYWTLEAHKEDVCEVGKMKNKKLVYLSPDAAKPLEQVRDDTAYIIGGLVDRTVIKYASLMRADELNIQARYLPIRQFMKNRTCLNLDHVVMIISKFKQCQSWKQAFQYGAPKRWKKAEDQYSIRKIVEESQQQEEKGDVQNSDNQEDEEKVNQNATQLIIKQTQSLTLEQQQIEQDRQNQEHQ